MQALLSFEKAPPLAAPLRFFLTAPCFALLAGLLLAWEGDALFASRWTPGALAATHLLTIGFMLQIMLGALIQILPVVAGANLRQPLWLARFLHLGLSVGALLLAAGFYWGRPDFLVSAALLLGVSTLYFLLAAGSALWGVPSTSPTIRGLKLACAGLAGVVGFGVLLALALAHGWALPLPAFVDLHAGWGFGAWGGILLAAIAYVVVPMFQLTPGYPARSSWFFPGAILSLLFGWTAATLFGPSWLAQLCQLAVALVGATFAALTLRLQGMRRRARADATYRYWQLGLLGGMSALAMLATAAVRPEIAEAPAWTLAFGILMLAAGFIPFIIGMLYKIVSFLAWLHLQNLGQGKVMAPPMNRLLPDAWADRQCLAYGLAVALLLGAVAFPGWLARPAGVSFALANAWLWLNLALAGRRYRQHMASIIGKLSEK